jgi:hypothetical protein
MSKALVTKDPGAKGTEQPLRIERLRTKQLRLFAALDSSIFVFSVSLCLCVEAGWFSHHFTAPGCDLVRHHLLLWDGAVLFLPSRA